MTRAVGQKLWFYHIFPYLQGFQEWGTPTDEGPCITEMSLLFTPATVFYISTFNAMLSDEKCTNTTQGIEHFNATRSPASNKLLEAVIHAL